MIDAPYLERFRGKRIVLLGLGREGASSFRFLRDAGIDCDIVAADRNPKALTAELHSLIDEPHRSLGPAYLDALRDADLIIKTAGIPGTLPEITAARERGVPITSNPAMFFDLVPVPVIGVTGTKGKSTTASTLAHVLTALGQRAHLLGNIGIPPLDALSAVTQGSVAVVELSSFQLAELDVSPHIAVLQHIAPEHLDFHGSFEAYRDAKLRIIRFQSVGDLLVYNHDSPTAAEAARACPARCLSFGLTRPPGDGCWADQATVFWRQDGKDTPLFDRSSVPLIGTFNLLNVMPAAVIAQAMSLDTTRLGPAVAGIG